MFKVIVKIFPTEYFWIFCIFIKTWMLCLKNLPIIISRTVLSPYDLIKCVHNFPGDYGGWMQLYSEKFKSHVNKNRCMTSLILKSPLAIHRQFMELEIKIMLSPDVILLFVIDSEINCEVQWAKNENTKFSILFMMMHPCNKWVAIRNTQK